MAIDTGKVDFEKKLINHYTEPNAKEKIEELHLAIVNMINDDEDLLNYTLAEVSNKIVAKNLKLSDLITDSRNSYITI